MAATARGTNGHKATHSPQAELGAAGSPFHAGEVHDGPNVTRLRRSDFFNPLLGEIFEATREAYREGLPVDAIDVHLRVTKTSQSSSAEIAAEIERALNAIPHHAHAETYAKEVLQDSQRRTLKARLTSALHAVDDKGLDLQDVVDLADGVTAHLNPLQVAQQFEFHTGPQLAELDCRVDYLIPGIFAANQPAIIGGSFKALKTSVSIDLTLSLALGLRFLGEFQVSRPVRTLLLSGESGAATIKETAIRVARSKGYSLSQFDGAMFGNQLPTLGNADSMAKLLATIKAAACKAEVVVIDPLYLSLPPDVEAANVFAMGTLLRSVADVFREAGSTPILVHHLKRHTGRESFTPPELSDLAWAGAAEFARQWILLGRREEFDPEVQLHRLWLSVGGSAGHSGMWGLDVDETPLMHQGPREWAVTLQKASAARAATVDEQVQRKLSVKEQKDAKLRGEHYTKLVNSLKKYPDGETKAIIRDTAGLHTKQFLPLFMEMLEAKEIEAVAIVKNRRTHEGFKLSREHSGTIGNPKPSRPGGHTLGNSLPKGDSRFPNCVETIL